MILSAAPVRTRRRMILQILQLLGIFFLFWQLPAGVAVFLFPFPYGVLAALLLAWLVLHVYLLRSGQPGEQRRWATLRLRPLRPRALLWTLAAVPVLLATTWGLWEVYAGLVPIPPETLNPFAPLTGTPLGRLSLALLAVAVAPLLEEFFFRGLIQRPLERRWGPARAILFTGALFAAVHLLPWILPLHLFLGLVFGWVVYATRSIWPAVILHAANNAAALLGVDGTEAPTTYPTVWETGLRAEWWIGVLFLAAGIVAGAYVGRRMWEASRE